MKSLNHPNVIRLHEVINPPNEEELLLVLDYAKYGEIMSWNEETRKFMPCSPDKEQFTEKEIQKLSRDIIRGIDYLHKKQIIHRDIKPQNIFLDENGVAEIGDYGCALKFHGNDDTLTDTKGTYYFLSPETCDTNVKKWAGKPVDIWAFGITLYAMTFNEVPFISDTVVGILDQILHTKLNLKSHRNISEGLENLILRCLDSDPETRITIDELKKNTWINEGFICSLDSPESHFISHITEEDITKKTFPVYAVLFVKKLGRLWRKRNEKKLKSGVSSSTVVKDLLEFSQINEEEDNLNKTEGYHPNMCKIVPTKPLSEVPEGDHPLVSIRENISNEELNENIKINNEESHEDDFMQSSAKGFSNLKQKSNHSSISDSDKLPPIQNKNSIEILPLGSPN